MRVGKRIKVPKQPVLLFDQTQPSIDVHHGVIPTWSNASVLLAPRLPTRRDVVVGPLEDHQRIVVGPPGELICSRDVRSNDISRWDSLERQMVGIQLVIATYDQRAQGVLLNQVP